mmetsp:Transcript_7637/g.18458  ORF Transcript_7637/g.18458 Transcript_7637/m.18458 type:complete len:799 (-) Transcript_7637:321-2717(-)
MQNPRGGTPAQPGTRAPNLTHGPSRKPTPPRNASQPPRPKVVGGGAATPATTRRPTPPRQGLPQHGANITAASSSAVPPAQKFRSHADFQAHYSVGGPVVSASSSSGPTMNDRRAGSGARPGVGTASASASSTNAKGRNLTKGKPTRRLTQKETLEQDVAQVKGAYDRLAALCHNEEQKESNLRNAVVQKRAITKEKEQLHGEAEDAYLNFVSEHANAYNELTTELHEMQKEIGESMPGVKVQNASNASLEQEVRALSAEREAAKEDADRAKKWSEQALLQMTNSDQELIDCKDLLQIARQNAMKVLGTLEEDRRILVELRQKAHAIKNHVQVFYVGESLDGQGGEVGGAGGGGRTGSGGLSTGTPRRGAQASDALQYVTASSGSSSSSSSSAKVDEHWYKDEVYAEHYTTAEVVDIPPWHPDYVRIREREEFNPGGACAGGGSSSSSYRQDSHSFGAGGGVLETEGGSSSTPEQLALGRIAGQLIETEVPYIRARMEQAHGSALLLFMGKDPTLFDAVASQIQSAFRDNSSRDRMKINLQENSGNATTTGVSAAGGATTTISTTTSKVARQVQKLEQEQYMFEGYRLVTVAEKSHVAVLGSKRKGGTIASTPHSVAELIKNPLEQSSCSLLHVPSESELKAVCELVGSLLASSGGSSSSSKSRSLGGPAGATGTSASTPSGTPRKQTEKAEPFNPNASFTSLTASFFADTTTPSASLGTSTKTLDFLRAFLTSGGSARAGSGKAVYVTFIMEEPAVEVLGRAMKLRALDSRGGIAMGEHERKGDLCKGAAEHERRNV